MTTLERDEIVDALRRLGELALGEGQSVRIVVVGGAAMVLGYSARRSTRDVDAVFLPPPAAAVVRKWAQTVASEQNLPEDWLNDGAKGFVVDYSPGPILLSDRGIEVRQPATEQLLAMKLCAWRDDVDIGDAACLLDAMDCSAGRDTIWHTILRFLVPGRELKARLAFDELWEQAHGHD
jgi:hypothetical protein